jgi:hypothetical protein
MFWKFWAAIGQEDVVATFVTAKIRNREHERPQQGDGNECQYNITGQQRENHESTKYHANKRPDFAHFCSVTIPPMIWLEARHPIIPKNFSNGYIL